MMFFMAIRLAFRALARNKLRAALTVLGILIGVAAVVAMTALGAGAQQRMESEFAAIGLNVLIIYPGSTATSGARGAQGTEATLTAEDARAITDEIPSVAAVAPVLGASAQVVYGANNIATQVTGSTPEYFFVRSWKIAKGSAWGESELRSSAKVCVLGETVRRELFGAQNPVGSTIRVGRIPCSVVGLLAPKGQSGMGRDQDDTIVMPITTFRARLSSRPGSDIDMIFASARTPDIAPRAAEKVTELLRQRHRLLPNDEDDFHVRNLQDLAMAFDAQRAAITLLLLAVASTSLLVGGIGVMNIMLVSVTERTREIGIRLAVGARGSDIMLQFLIEAVVLAALGGIGGLAIGLLTTQILAHTTDWTVRIQPVSSVVAVLVAGGIGVVFGFFPARRAAKLDPIVALRRE